MNKLKLMGKDHLIITLEYPKHPTPDYIIHCGKLFAFSESDMKHVEVDFFDYDGEYFKGVKATLESMQPSLKESLKVLIHHLNNDPHMYTYWRGWFKTQIYLSIGKGFDFKDPLLDKAASACIDKIIEVYTPDEEGDIQVNELPKKIHADDLKSHVSDVLEMAIDFCLNQIPNGGKVIHALSNLKDVVHGHIKPKFPSGGIIGGADSGDEFVKQRAERSALNFEREYMQSPVPEIDKYDKQEIEKASELLNADNFFKYAKMANNQLLDEYLKSTKGIYHDADINIALEKFADWVTSGGSATSKNFLAQNQEPKNEQNQSTILQESLIKQAERIEILETRENQMMQHIQDVATFLKAFKNRCANHINPTASDIGEIALILKQADLYSNVDTSKEILEEKLPQHKNSSHACGQITPYFDFLDSYVKSNTSFNGWEDARVKLDYRALFELRDKADTRYKLYLGCLENRKVEDTKFTMNIKATDAFEKLLKDSGINPKDVVAYSTESGFRVIKYNADNVRHLSICGLDRLPTIQELQYFRMEMYPELDQMAWVLRNCDKEIDKTYSFTFIELFYK